MLRSIIIILIGIVILLIGLVITISEGFSSKTYLISIGLIFSGLTISTISVLGKIKKWF